MFTTTHGGGRRPHVARALVIVSAVAVGAFGVSACSTIAKIKTAVHDIRGNKATIDSFSSSLKSAPTTFSATYVTTGSAPATVVYAAQAQSKAVSFSDTPTGGAGDTTPVHLISNSSGFFLCSKSSPSAALSCQKLGTAEASNQQEVLGFYTPAHWITFLRDFSLAAGFAGDKVTSSTMSLNGFAMKCVVFRASGVPGTSTICSTSQGLLGYVKVATETTSFEITKYSTSPPASLFVLPPGAKVLTNQDGAS